MLWADVKFKGFPGVSSAAVPIISHTLFLVTCDMDTGIPIAHKSFQGASIRSEWAISFQITWLWVPLSSQHHVIEHVNKVKQVCELLPVAIHCLKYDNWEFQPKNAQRWRGKRSGTPQKDAYKQIDIDIDRIFHSLQHFLLTAWNLTVSYTQCRTL